MLQGLFSAGAAQLIEQIICDGLEDTLLLIGTHMISGLGVDEHIIGKEIEVAGGNFHADLIKKALEHVASNDGLKSKISAFEDLDREASPQRFERLRQDIAQGRIEDMLFQGLNVHR